MVPGIGKVLKFFKTALGRNSWDGQGGQLPVAVHLGRGMDNAFFVGGERPFIVHRLDRETSGLLVFAKSEAAKPRQIKVSGPSQAQVGNGSGGGSSKK